VPQNPKLSTNKNTFSLHDKTGSPSQLIKLTTDECSTSARHIKCAV